MTEPSSLNSMPRVSSSQPGNAEHITLAGGCFWCLEAVFDRVDGVLDVQSGYANGQVDHPYYEQVCTGQTGHAEVIQVAFDPSRIALQDLLTIFFATHDPTTLNRQGHDEGTQYRSGIYWNSPAQEAVVRGFVDDLKASKAFGEHSIVTELEPLTAFWAAEPGHDDYFARNPNQGYCALVIAPKIEKFQRTLSRYLARY